MRSFQLDRLQRQKKKKETKNTVKSDLCFILGGTQQCNFYYYKYLKQRSVIVKQSPVYQCTARKRAYN